MTGRGAADEARLLDRRRQKEDTSDGPSGPIESATSTDECEGSFEIFDSDSYTRVQPPDTAGSFERTATQRRTSGDHGAFQPSEPASPGGRVQLPITQTEQTEKIFSGNAASKRNSLLPGAESETHTVTPARPTAVRVRPRPPPAYMAPLADIQITKVRSRAGSQVPSAAVTPRGAPPPAVSHAAAHGIAAGVSQAQAAMERRMASRIQSRQASRISRRLSPRSSFAARGSPQVVQQNLLQAREALRRFEEAAAAGRSSGQLAGASAPNATSQTTGVQRGQSASEPKEVQSPPEKLERPQELLVPHADESDVALHRDNRTELHEGRISSPTGRREISSDVRNNVLYEEMEPKIGRDSRRASHTEKAVRLDVSHAERVQTDMMRLAQLDEERRASRIASRAASRPISRSPAFGSSSALNTRGDVAKAAAEELSRRLAAEKSGAASDAQVATLGPPPGPRDLSPTRRALQETRPQWNRRVTLPDQKWEVDADLMGKLRAGDVESDASIPVRDFCTAPVFAHLPLSDHGDKARFSEHASGVISLKDEGSAPKPTVKSGSRRNGSLIGRFFTKLLTFSSAEATSPNLRGRRSFVPILSPSQRSPRSSSLSSSSESSFQQAGNQATRSFPSPSPEEATAGVRGMSRPVHNRRPVRLGKFYEQLPRKALTATYEHSDGLFQFWPQSDGASSASSVGTSSSGSHSDRAPGPPNASRGRPRTWRGPASRVMRRYSTEKPSPQALSDRQPAAPPQQPELARNGPLEGRRKMIGAAVLSPSRSSSSSTSSRSLSPESFAVHRRPSPVSLPVLDFSWLEKVAPRRDMRGLPPQPRMSRPALHKKRVHSDEYERLTARLRRQQLSIAREVSLLVNRCSVRPGKRRILRRATVGPVGQRACDDFFRVKDSYQSSSISHDPFPLFKESIPSSVEKGKQPALDSVVRGSRGAAGSWRELLASKAPAAVGRPLRYHLTANTGPENLSLSSSVSVESDRESSRGKCNHGASVMPVSPLAWLSQDEHTFEVGSAIAESDTADPTSEGYQFTRGSPQGNSASPSQHNAFLDFEAHTSDHPVPDRSLAVLSQPSVFGRAVLQGRGDRRIGRSHSLGHPFPTAAATSSNFSRFGSVKAGKIMYTSAQKNTPNRVGGTKERYDGLYIIAVEPLLERRRIPHTSHGHQDNRLPLAVTESEPAPLSPEESRTLPSEDAGQLPRVSSQREPTSARLSPNSLAALDVKYAVPRLEARTAVSRQRGHRAHSPITALRRRETEAHRHTTHPRSSKRSKSVDSLTVVVDMTHSEPTRGGNLTEEAVVYPGKRRTMEDNDIEVPMERPHTIIEKDASTLTRMTRRACSVSEPLLKDRENDNVSQTRLTHTRMRSALMSSVKDTSPALTQEMPLGGVRSSPDNKSEKQPPYGSEVLTERPRDVVDRYAHSKSELTKTSLQNTSMRAREQLLSTESVPPVVQPMQQECEKNALDRMICGTAGKEFVRHREASAASAGSHVSRDAVSYEPASHVARPQERGMESSGTQLNALVPVRSVNGNAPASNAEPEPSLPSMIIDLVQSREKKPTRILETTAGTSKASALTESRGKVDFSSGRHTVEKKHISSQRATGRMHKDGKVPQVGVNLGQGDFCSEKATGDVATAPATASEEAAEPSTLTVEKGARPQKIPNAQFGALKPRVGAFTGGAAPAAGSGSQQHEFTGEGRRSKRDNLLSKRTSPQGQSSGKGSPATPQDAKIPPASGLEQPRQQVKERLPGTDEVSSSETDVVSSIHKERDDAIQVREVPMKPKHSPDTLPKKWWPPSSHRAPAGPEATDIKSASTRSRAVAETEVDGDVLEPVAAHIDRKDTSSAGRRDVLTNFHSPRESRVKSLRRIRSATNVFTNCTAAVGRMSFEGVSKLRSEEKVPHRVSVEGDRWGVSPGNDVTETLGNDNAPTATHQRAFVRSSDEKSAEKPPELHTDHIKGVKSSTLSARESELTRYVKKDDTRKALSQMERGIQRVRDTKTGTEVGVNALCKGVGYQMESGETQSSQRQSLAPVNTAASSGTKAPAVERCSSSIFHRDSSGDLRKKHFGESDLEGMLPCDGLATGRTGQDSSEAIPAQHSSRAVWEASGTAEVLVEEDTGRRKTVRGDRSVLEYGEIICATTGEPLKSGTSASSGQRSFRAVEKAYCCTEWQRNSPPSFQRKQEPPEPTDSPSAAAGVHGSRPQPNDVGRLPQTSPALADNSMLPAVMSHVSAAKNSSKLTTYPRTANSTAAKDETSKAAQVPLFGDQEAGTKKPRPAVAPKCKRELCAAEKIQTPGEQAIVESRHTAELDKEASVGVNSSLGRSGSVAPSPAVTVRKEANAVFSCATINEREISNSRDSSRIVNLHEDSRIVKADTDTTEKSGDGSGVLKSTSDTDQVSKTDDLSGKKENDSEQKSGVPRSSAEATSLTANEQITPFTVNTGNTKTDALCTTAAGSTPASLKEDSPLRLRQHGNSVPAGTESSVHADLRIQRSAIKEPADANKYPNSDLPSAHLLPGGDVKDMWSRRGSVEQQAHKAFGGSTLHTDATRAEGAAGGGVKSPKAIAQGNCAQDKVAEAKDNLSKEDQSLKTARESPSVHDRQATVRLESGSGAVDRSTTLAVQSCSPTGSKALTDDEDEEQKDAVETISDGSRMATGARRKGASTLAVEANAGDNIYSTPPVSEVGEKVVQLNQMEAMMQDENARVTRPESELKHTSVEEKLPGETEAADTPVTVDKEHRNHTRVRNPTWKVRGSDAEDSSTTCAAEPSADRWVTCSTVKQQKNVGPIGSAQIADSLLPAQQKEAPVVEKHHFISPRASTMRAPSVKRRTGEGSASISRRRMSGTSALHGSQSTGEESTTGRRGLRGRTVMPVGKTSQRGDHLRKEVNTFRVQNPSEASAAVSAAKRTVLMHPGKPGRPKDHFKGFIREEVVRTRPANSPLASEGGTDDSVHSRAPAVAGVKCSGGAADAISSLGDVASSPSKKPNETATAASFARGTLESHVPRGRLAQKTNTMRSKASQAALRLQEERSCKQVPLIEVKDNKAQDVYPSRRVASQDADASNADTFRVQGSGASAPPPTPSEQAPPSLGSCHSKAHSNHSPTVTVPQGVRAVRERGPQSSIGSTSRWFSAESKTANSGPATSTAEGNKDTSRKEKVFNNGMVFVEEGKRRGSGLSMTETDDEMERWDSTMCSSPPFSPRYIPPASPPSRPSVPPLNLYWLRNNPRRPSGKKRYKDLVKNIHPDLRVAVEAPRIASVALPTESPLQSDDELDRKKADIVASLFDDLMDMDGEGRTHEAPAATTQQMAPRGSTCRSSPMTSQDRALDLEKSPELKAPRGEHPPICGGLGAPEEFLLGELKGIHPSRVMTSDLATQSPAADDETELAPLTGGPGRLGAMSGKKDAVHSPVVVPRADIIDKEQYLDSLSAALDADHRQVDAVHVGAGCGVLYAGRKMEDGTEDTAHHLYLDTHQEEKDCRQLPSMLRLHRDNGEDVLERSIKSLENGYGPAATRRPEEVHDPPKVQSTMGTNNSSFRICLPELHNRRDDLLRDSVHVETCAKKHELRNAPFSPIVRKSPQRKMPSGVRVAKGSEKIRQPAYVVARECGSASARSVAQGSQRRGKKLELSKAATPLYPGLAAGDVLPARQASGLRGQQVTCRQRMKEDQTPLCSTLHPTVRGETSKATLHETVVAGGTLNSLRNSVDGSLSGKQLSRGVADEGAGASQSLKEASLCLDKVLESSRRCAAACEDPNSGRANKSSGRRPKSQASAENIRALIKSATMLLRSNQALGTGSTATADDDLYPNKNCKDVPLDTDVLNRRKGGEPVGELPAAHLERLGNSDGSGADGRNGGVSSAKRSARLERVKQQGPSLKTETLVSQSTKAPATLDRFSGSVRLHPSGLSFRSDTTSSATRGATGVVGGADAARASQITSSKSDDLVYTVRLLEGIPRKHSLVAELIQSFENMARRRQTEKRSSSSSVIGSGKSVLARQKDRATRSVPARTPQAGSEPLTGSPTTFTSNGVMRKKESSSRGNVNLSGVAPSPTSTRKARVNSAETPSQQTKERVLTSDAQSLGASHTKDVIAHHRQSPSIEETRSGTFDATPRKVPPVSLPAVAHGDQTSYVGLLKETLQNGSRRLSETLPTEPDKATTQTALCARASEEAEICSSSELAVEGGHATKQKRYTAACFPRSHANGCNDERSWSEERFAGKTNASERHRDVDGESHMRNIYKGRQGGITMNAAPAEYRVFAQQKVVASSVSPEGHVSAERLSRHEPEARDNFSDGLHSPIRQRFSQSVLLEQQGGILSTPDVNTDAIVNDDACPIGSMTSVRRSRPASRESSGKKDFRVQTKAADYVRAGDAVREAFKIRNETPNIIGEEGDVCDPAVEIADALHVAGSRSPEDSDVRADTGEEAPLGGGTVGDDDLETKSEAIVLGRSEHISRRPFKTATLSSKAEETDLLERGAPEETKAANSTISTIVGARPQDKRWDRHSRARAETLLAGAARLKKAAGSFPRRARAAAERGTANSRKIASFGSFSEHAITNNDPHVSPEAPGGGDVARHPVDAVTARSLRGRARAEDLRFVKDGRMYTVKETNSSVSSYAAGVAADVVSTEIASTSTWRPPELREAPEGASLAHSKQAKRRVSYQVEFPASRREELPSGFSTGKTINVKPVRCLSDGAATKEMSREKKSSESLEDMKAVFLQSWWKAVIVRKWVDAAKCVRDLESRTSSVLSPARVQANECCLPRSQDSSYADKDHMKKRAAPAEAGSMAFSGATSKVVQRVEYAAPRGNLTFDCRRRRFAYVFFDALATERYEKQSKASSTPWWAAPSDIVAEREILEAEPICGRAAGHRPYNNLSTVTTAECEAGNVEKKGFCQHILTPEPPAIVNREDVLISPSSGLLLQREQRKHLRRRKFSTQPEAPVSKEVESTWRPRRAMTDTSGRDEDDTCFDRMSMCRLQRPGERFYENDATECYCRSEGGDRYHRGDFVGPQGNRFAMHESHDHGIRRHDVLVSGRHTEEPRGRFERIEDRDDAHVDSIRRKIHVVERFLPQRQNPVEEGSQNWEKQGNALDESAKSCKQPQFEAERNGTRKRSLCSRVKQGDRPARQQDTEVSERTKAGKLPEESSEEQASLFRKNETVQPLENMERLVGQASRRGCRHELRRKSLLAPGEPKCELPDAKTREAQPGKGDKKEALRNTAEGRAVGQRESHAHDDWCDAETENSSADTEQKDNGPEQQACPGWETGRDSVDAGRIDEVTRKGSIPGALPEPISSETLRECLPGAPAQGTESMEAGIRIVEQEGEPEAPRNRCLPNARMEVGSSIGSIWETPSPTDRRRDTPKEGAHARQEQHSALRSSPQRSQNTVENTLSATSEGQQSDSGTVGEAALPFTEAFQQPLSSRESRALAASHGKKERTLPECARREPDDYRKGDPVRMQGDGSVRIQGHTTGEQKKPATYAALGDMKMRSPSRDHGDNAYEGLPLRRVSEECVHSNTRDQCGLTDAPCTGDGVTAVASEDERRDVADLGDGPLVVSPAAEVVWPPVNQVLGEDVPSEASEERRREPSARVSLEQTVAENHMDSQRSSCSVANAPAPASDDERYFTTLEADEEEDTLAQIVGAKKASLL